MKLKDVIAALKRVHQLPKRAPYRNVFEAIVGENAAYLVSDEQRFRTFATLKKEVGVTPKAIAGAPKSKLVKAIREGGMLPPMRADKLKKAAELALKFGFEKLDRFPGFGGAAVDKLRMEWGGERVLALDSNALRVLQRVGLGVTAKNYATSYAQTQKVLAADVPRTAKGRSEAAALLRMHGQTICKTTRPRCSECPLADRCPEAAKQATT